MESGVTRGDLKRDKFWTVMVFLLALFAFLVVFQPIRRVESGKFRDVAFTYRYEQPLSPSEAQRDKLRDALKKALIEAKVDDARVSFPTTTEVRIRVPLQGKQEVDSTDASLKDVLGKAIPADAGKLTDSEWDHSAFGDMPWKTLGPIGLYRPKLALKLGLDLQGGVQLVLKARTQNTEYDFKLADSADDLNAALAGSAKAGADAKADTAKSGPANTKAGAEPAKTGAEPAKAGTDNSKAGAESTKAGATDKGTAEKTGTTPTKEPAKTGNTAPDGGQPVRMAQANPADKPADSTEGGVETAANEADAKLLADPELRAKVTEKINQWADGLHNLYKDRWGDIDVEVVGSNVVVVRTLVDRSKPRKEQLELATTQQQTFLTDLKAIFAKARVQGDPRDMDKDRPKDPIQQVKEVVQRRVDRLGVAEAQVVTQGTDRVQVELPGIKDPDEAVQLLGTTAMLEFRKVPEKYVPHTEHVGGKETTTFQLKDSGQTVPTEVVYYEAPDFDGNKNILTGADLVGSQVAVSFDESLHPAVGLKLTSAGATKFDRFAKDNFKKYLAIYLDHEIISAPVMQATEFHGQVRISGGFETVEEANNLKILLSAGSLSVPVDVVEQRTVSATLGADSVRQSARAGLIGTILIVLMMFALFKVSGLLADLALMLYCIYTLAVLVAVGATLTMPGILGLLLSVGMAVDANVIVFERLKEEMAAYPQRPVSASIKHAYERSWPAIIDGNITCLFQSIVLYGFGTGPIRGFAVTLFIGIFCHLFTALFVTRRLQNLLAVTAIGQSHRAYRQARPRPADGSKPKYPFPIIPRTWLWLTLSTLVVVAGVAKMGMNYSSKGKALDFGIDYTGGASYVFKFEKLPASVAADVITKIRQPLEAGGLNHLAIQVFTNGNQVQIRTATGSDKADTTAALAKVKAEGQKLTDLLTANFGKVEMVGQELVGPVIGQYLRTQGFIAVLLGCTMIMFYIWFRYNIGGLGGGYLFGVCALIALIHDVLVMLCAYAFTGHDIDTTFIAAVLTVVGFSVQDTVVIFDRIRENLRRLDPLARRDINQVADVVEASLWQTMTRSVVTVLSTLLPLICLVIGGGVHIRNFAFAMFVGIFSGGYSSIFNASPLLMLVNRRVFAKRAASEPQPITRAAARPRPTAAALSETPTSSAPKAGPGALTVTPPKPSAPTAGSPAAPAASGDAAAKAKAPKKTGGKGKRRY
jgi:SecD/SecF fusion protein